MRIKYFEQGYFFMFMKTKFKQLLGELRKDDGKNFLEF